MLKIIEVGSGEFPFEYEHKIVYATQGKYYAFIMKCDKEQCQATIEKAIANFLGIKYGGVFIDRLFEQNRSKLIKELLKAFNVKNISKMDYQEAFNTLFDIYKDIKPTLKQFLVEKGLTQEELDGYESDLYVKYSIQAVEFILEYGKTYNVQIVTEYFLSEMDGSKWMSLPFQNMTSKGWIK